MTSLVTLAEIKTQLRITHPWEDDALTATGLYASAWVLDWIKTPQEWDDATVPPLAKAATLKTVEYLWVRRGGDAELGVNPETRQPDGQLPTEIANMLYRYRDPALA